MWNCVTSPEALTVCVQQGHKWLEAIGGLFGLGLFAVVLALAGYIRHLHKRQKEHLRLLDERGRRAVNAEAAVASASTAQAQFDQRLEEERTRASSLEAVIARFKSESELLREAVQSNAEAAEVRHDALEVSKMGDSAFWRQPPLPLHDAGLPIQLRTACPTLMFANQKGGVGKTTVVANVAAYLASRGFNVLAVDLDYQGSLSYLMRLEQFGPQGPPYPPATDLKTVLQQPFRKGDWPIGELSNAVQTATSEILPAEGVTVPGQLKYLPADYDLSQVERSVEYAWILKTLDDDPRYRLASFLHHAQEKLGFDFVLIDSPPRFTLGFVNGLCAATHIFVPTVVDAVSTYAVEKFARQYSSVASRLNPSLRWGGIIGMMTQGNNDGTLPATHLNFAESAERAARNRIPGASGFMFGSVVPRNQQIAMTAAEGIPYLHSGQLRQQGVIQRLGKAILEVVHEQHDSGPIGTSNSQPAAVSAA